ncbi:MAG: FAD-binding oxidoreductase [Alphaproteobacteria bacterium]|nr:FAD-binding oxidoreductase [Alphaproteobacteria bacterium]
MATPSRRAVLIGGGITGTLSAHALLRAGWDVTLLEGAHVGAGSSSRTAAGIRQQFSTRETVLGMRYAVQVYRDWKAQLGGELSPIRQSGYLFLFDTEDGYARAKERVADQQAWGLREVEALDADEVGRRFPFVDPETLTGASWCPTDGFLAPELVYNDAAAATRAAGGRVVQGAPVTGARHAGGRLSAVETPKGVFEGDLFLDCTNAWTRRVGAILGATPLPVAALKRYLWFIERDGPMTPEALMAMPLTIAPSGAYCRPENAGSLLVGWKHDAPDEAASFSYEDQDSVEPEFFHKSGADARPFDAWMALAEVLPPLAEFAGISATTAGFYGTTPDHNPFLDFDPQVPNLIRLVGFSGHGAMFGPFTAAVAVGLAEAGRSIEHVEVLGEQAELSCFRIGREMGGGEAMVI